ncbi:hypothetical protein ACJX0J_030410 [Zea mays]
MPTCLVNSEELWQAPLFILNEMMHNSPVLFSLVTIGSQTYNIIAQIPQLCLYNNTSMGTRAHVVTLYLNLEEQSIKKNHGQDWNMKELACLYKEQYLNGDERYMMDIAHVVTLYLNLYKKQADKEAIYI